MSHLALVLRNQGKYEEAEQINRQSLALRKMVLGKEHPDMLESMNLRASILYRHGKHFS